MGGKKKDIMKMGLWREARDFQIIFVYTETKERKPQLLGTERTAGRVNAKI